MSLIVYYTTMSYIAVFTDGGCSNNGRHNARAASAVHFVDYPTMSESRLLPGRLQTNNRAEFYAAIMAMEKADIIDPPGSVAVRPLKIYTDSNLLVQTVTKWMGKWEKNGWTKKGLEPIKNLDLVQTIAAQCKLRPIHWEHVIAHSGNTDFKSVNNHIVDRMCAKCLRDL